MEGNFAIQVDIGGHRPFPTSSKQFSGNFGFLLFLAGFNFRGHFEALNDVFGNIGSQYSIYFNIEAKMNLLYDTFPMGYHMPKTEIVCKSYDPGKLMYRLTQTGPTLFLALHLLGLGF